VAPEVAGVAERNDDQAQQRRDGQQRRQDCNGAKRKGRRCTIAGGRGSKRANHR
jgi:hypothetical protein